VNEDSTSKDLSLFAVDIFDPKSGKEASTCLKKKLQMPRKESLKGNVEREEGCG